VTREFQDTNVIIYSGFVLGMCGKCITYANFMLLSRSPSIVVAGRDQHGSTGKLPDVNHGLTKHLFIGNGRGFHTLQGLRVRVPGGQGGALVPLYP
jgi:hypothetical protein